MLLTVSLVVSLLLGACGPASTPAPGVTTADPRATATPKVLIPLEGTEWLLSSLQGQPLLPGTHITLRFREGQAEGFAGCNAYGGGYKATGEETLWLPEMEITAMACPSPEGVMDQEQAYVEALASAATYLTTNGYLEIENRAGETVLVFARQETQGRLVQKEKLASVGQLAAGVAHEINNPLGTVLLYSDILHKETPEDDQQQREDLQMIIREATRCKAIVNDLLNFSRQNEVLAQETDLNDLLREMVKELSRQALYQQVKLVTDLQPDLSPIQADRLQLGQVFLNLMNNAAEAMPGGGRLILRSWNGPGAGFVTVQVQDTGVGISEENMKKLFTPFFTTKPIGKGTGLGLAISYGIVKMHRGQISVQSQVGEGTTFSVTLQERLPARVEEDTVVLQ